MGGEVVHQRDALTPLRPSGVALSPRERDVCSLIGVRFRLHGREPATGLDCVGVVAWVYRVSVPTGYRLRTADLARVEDGLRGLGFVPGNGAAGEVVVLRPGGAQVHLGIVTPSCARAGPPGGFVHADAGLGRVVESPWRADWPVLSFWRRG